MAAAAIVLGLGAAWTVSALRPGPAPAPAPTPSAVARTGPKEIDLSEVPVTGEHGLLTGDKTATCVAGYLPKGAFGRAPDFSWLCAETDPRRGAGRLRAAVIEAKPKGEGVTRAMKLLSMMGWYEMAAYAVVRAGCCTNAPPLQLPDPHPDCARVDELLRDIGRRVVAAQSCEEPLQAYRQAVHCELNHKRGNVYWRTARPMGGEDTAFMEMVRSLAQP